MELKYFLFERQTMNLNTTFTSLYNIQRNGKEWKSVYDINIRQKPVKIFGLIAIIFRELSVCYWYSTSQVVCRDSFRKNRTLLTSEIKSNFHFVKSLISLLSLCMRFFLCLKKLFSPIHEKTTLETNWCVYIFANIFIIIKQKAWDYSHFSYCFKAKKIHTKSNF